MVLALYGSVATFDRTVLALYGPVTTLDSAILTLYGSVATLYRTVLTIHRPISYATTSSVACSNTGGTVTIATEVTTVKAVVHAEVLSA